MFARKTPEENGLQDAIDILLARLSEADNDEATKIVNQINVLSKLKETETPKRISPDTLVLVGGNLAGILLILKYEQLNVLTSKAVNFVMKLR